MIMRLLVDSESTLAERPEMLGGQLVQMEERRSEVGVKGKLQVAFRSSRVESSRRRG